MAQCLPRRLQVKLMRIQSVSFNSCFKKQKQTKTTNHQLVILEISALRLTSTSLHPHYLRLPNKAATHELHWEQCTPHTNAKASPEHPLEVSELYKQHCNNLPTGMMASSDSKQTSQLAFVMSIDMTTLKKLSASGARTLLLTKIMPLSDIKHKHSHKLAQDINMKCKETEGNGSLKFNFKIPLSKPSYTTSIWLISKEGSHLMQFSGPR